MTPDPEPPAPEPPPTRTEWDTTSLIAGFLFAAAVWLLPVVMPSGGRTTLNNAILLLVGVTIGLPFVSVILAIIPKTRRFGLGALLACGLGWLILGAICGGLIK